jgi:ABC-type polysaccharide/polyol phosphate transport system ATPase subunit
MVTQHCQHALLLEGGQIIRTGPAEDVINHYDEMCNSQMSG